MTPFPTLVTRSTLLFLAVGSFTAWTGNTSAFADDPPAYDVRHVGEMSLPSEENLRIVNVRWADEGHRLFIKAWLEDSTHRVFVYDIDEETASLIQLPTLPLVILGAEL